MSGLTPQRPGLHPRQISSSSFAEAFDVARSKLDKFDPYSDDDDTLSPVLSLNGSVTSEDTPQLTDVDDSPLDSVSPITQPGTPQIDPDVVDNFAFAFDIDGVLIRGGRPIPEAIEAMKVLNGENEFGIKV